jgi:SOS-response transcriptional repressor LexA
VVERFQQSRRTFSEEDALADVWASGEDIRLREDPRFWEIAGCGHFHLSNHRLANRVLAERLWQGVWDGSDLDAELERLDLLEPGTFHVFCGVDPHLQLSDGKWTLVARSRRRCPSEVATVLDALFSRLLDEHTALVVPRTTRELLEMAVRLNESLELGEDALDHLEAWLDTKKEWTEIGRGLWLPSTLVPQPGKPKPFRVRAVRGTAGESAPGVEDFEVIEVDQEAGTSEVIERLVISEPPVERHADASVTWTHTLRTIHIYYGYLPVPTGARFRYPRFVGRMGPVAISALLHDTGQRGFLWLDRDHHRFFGDFLRSAIEWEEAGRRLQVRWAPDAVVITHGEIDEDVREEERRLIEPEVLNELRKGLGESYRQSLAQILIKNRGALSFRPLYEGLVKRVGHRPSRGTVRTVLSASPEFVKRGQAWQWQEHPEAARVFRRNIVLTELGIDPHAPAVDLGRLARVVTRRVNQLAGSVAETPLVDPTKAVASPAPVTERVKILPFRGEKIAPPSTVPLIPLRIAAGGFSQAEEALEPEGWVEVDRRGDLRDYFAAYVHGRSMEPLIPDGGLCLFRRHVGGARKDRILLVQDRRIVDPDTGGAFTVKRYRRVTPITEDESREHVEIHLLPENPSYPPIVLRRIAEGEVEVRGEFVQVIETH